MAEPQDITVKVNPPAPHSKKQALIMQAFQTPGLREIYVAMGTKFGKACVINEHLPTVTGWKTMGDIVVGDYVFDEHGKHTRVTSVTDVMYGHKCYEMVFSDGSSVKVDAEHEWVTETHNCRKNRARVLSANNPKHNATNSTPEKVTTEEIRETLLKSLGGKDRPNHSIPIVSGALDFLTKDLPLDPYTLGVWLGDGSSWGGGITNPEESIIDDVRAAGFTVNKVKGPSSPYGWYAKELVTILKEMNLYRNKHIPPQYLVADKDQRLALLQGLMDTDGTISKRGDCTFDNTNKNLADGVEALAISMGIKCTRTQRFGKLYGVEKNLCYRIHFTTDLPVFRLASKAYRLREVSPKAKMRYIVEVNPIESEPVKCITVDNPTHLFLVGRGCIPTHNSIGASVCMASAALKKPRGKWRWIAPIYEQAKIGMDYFAPILPPSPHSEIQTSNMRIYLPYLKAEIKFWHTRDPVSLEGAGIHGNIHDEAAKQPYEAIVSAKTTTTFTGGPSMYISTPYGKNWFYNSCMEAKDQMNWALANGKVPEKIFLTAPTSDNPHVTQAIIDAAKKALPKRLFEQYYLAQFVDDGTVFVGFRKCLRGPELDISGGDQRVIHTEAKERKVVIAVDWAKKEDYTVFGAFDYESDVPEMLGFHRFQGITYIDACRELFAFCKEFGDVGIIYHDKTGVGETLDELLGTMPFAYEGITFSSRTKSTLVNQFMLTLEKGDIVLLNWPEMLKELDAYEVRVNELGTARYSAPKGMHDDIVVMLILANAALQDFRGQGMVIHTLENLPDKKILSIDKWYGEMIQDAHEDEEQYDRQVNPAFLFGGDF